MKHTPLLLGALSCISLSGIYAQSDTVNLPTVEVHSSPTSLLPSSSLTPAADSEHRVSSALETLPGLTMRRTGASGSEPVIRGLGWERVQTRFNGLPLIGACPSRMDPPVNLIALDSLDAVWVDVGPASVLQGPPGTAGSVNLSTELQTSETSTVSALTTADVESQGKARRGKLRIQGAASDHAWRVDSSMEKQTDYTSGDGTRVPADAEHQEVSLHTLKQLENGHSFSVGGHWKHETDTEYVALPMDSRYAKTLLGTAEWKWTSDSEGLLGVEVRGGLANTDHRMDNRNKPNRMMMQASTPSEADSSTLRVLSRWSLGDGELRLGADTSRLERDATRTRTVRAVGKTFRDPIWPGLEQEQAGLFSEWEGNTSSNLNIRAGIRTDWIESDASRAEETLIPGGGYGKTTVAAAYQDVGGSDGSIEQQDNLWSGNLRAQTPISDTWNLQVSLARTEAVPNLTQRYQSFGPVPGGFGVGTPDLEPEVKYEAELRSEGSLGEHQVGLALHASRIDAFLLPTTLTRLDVNGDGRIDRVKGYRNQDVERWGLEAEAELVLSDTLQLPVTVEWVRARTTDGEDVPEIPPLELQAALQWSPESECRFVGEFGVRYAHKQTRIDSGFGEDETPSFALLHLRIGFQPIEDWTVSFGIENLLDRNYHEHTTRETLLPVGDLGPGDEIPGPGRNFTLSVRTRW